MGLWAPVPSIGRCTGKRRAQCFVALDARCVAVRQVRQRLPRSTICESQPRLRTRLQASCPRTCMSGNAEDGAQQQQQTNSFYAALARTATRSIALYFSRPVRLFRPSKGASIVLGGLSWTHRSLVVSGWHSLRGLADSHGKSLSPSYLSWLVKEHGVRSSGRIAAPFIS